MKSQIVCYSLLLVGFCTQAQNAITLDPATTAPTQAKLLIEGAGPIQNIPSYYFPLSERMGIKAIAAPTNGTKTTAIVGISDYKLGSPLNENGEATGVIGFSSSRTKSYGVQGIADGAGSGTLAIGVKGHASSVSSNSTIYGGYFTAFREGASAATGYGIHATTYHNYGSGSGNSIGGYFGALGKGNSTKTGVYSTVDHVANTGSDAVGAYGFKTDISGKYNSEVIGLLTNITTGGTNGTYGARFDVLGNGSGEQVGVKVNVKSTGTTSASPHNRMGFYADVEGTAWNYSYGIIAKSKIVPHPGAGIGLASYGGYFVATGSAISQFGVYATADAPNQVQTNRYAGYFVGNVGVVGTLSKSSGTFKIDHPQDPENKYLYHSFVESPDMMNVYNGTITTDANGEATVSLPNYFEALNTDFRYQLTPIGQYSQVFVAEKVKNNQFKIKSDKANVEISWQVTGIRNDPYAQKNRVVVEVEKAKEDKGKYLTPDAYGLDKSKGINYNSNQESLKQ